MCFIFLFQTNNPSIKCYEQKIPNSYNSTLNCTIRHPVFKSGKVSPVIKFGNVLKNKIVATPANLQSYLKWGLQLQPQFTQMLPQKKKIL